MAKKKAEGARYDRPKDAPFDGDATRFRLGIEAHRLGLAYEHDPYFSLSIARIDPLPHQLEAVYEYFLKTPRIRCIAASLLFGPVARWRPTGAPMSAS